MKTTYKIAIAAFAGTTFMTLYSYWKSKKERQQYIEPVVLNKLVDKSENLPDIQNEALHPAGWVLHYLTGLGFMAAYWLLYRRLVKYPNARRIIIAGAISGVIGIAVWKTVFAQHKKPPYNNRYGYYRQLFIAHIIFTAFALTTYKIADKSTQ
jgi:hypothetical protein